jgi:hypothetical protein
MSKCRIQKKILNKNNIQLVQHCFDQLKDERQKRYNSNKNNKTSPEVEIHIVMSINNVLKVKILYFGSI